jgi:hypothetical protein
MAGDGNDASVLRIANFAALLVLVGCTGGDGEHEAGSLPSDFEDLGTLEEGERREFAARLRNDLRDAEARRRRQLNANAVVLDRLDRLPGAQLVAEQHQGDDTSELDVPDDEFEYRLYLESTVRPYTRFELVTADRWNTYRRYRLPTGVSTHAVHRFYARQLQGWAHLARERERHRAGHQVYADDFWRNGRCIWVHVGLTESPDIAGRRTLTVATSANTRDACV